MPAFLWQYWLSKPRKLQKTIVGKLAICILIRDGNFRYYVYIVYKKQAQYDDPVISEWSKKINCKGLPGQHYQ